mgnify:FL=1
MALKVCALLLPRTTTDQVAVEIVSTLRATLTQKYPLLTIPAEDIDLMEQILKGLRYHQKISTINKLQTLKSGSLIEEH